MSEDDDTMPYPLYQDYVTQARRIDEILAGWNLRAFKPSAERGAPEPTSGPVDEVTERQRRELIEQQMWLSHQHCTVFGDNPNCSGVEAHRNDVETSIADLLPKPVI